MSKIYVDEIAPKTGSNVFIKQPAGSIVQTQFTQYTSTTTVAFGANTPSTIDVLSVTITPSSASSIIKLDSHIFFEHSVATQNWNSMFFFYRDATRLGHPQTGSRLCGITSGLLNYYAGDNNSTAEIANYSFFDSPNTTSAVTYKVGFIANLAETLHINKTVADTDSTAYERGTSYISATEIAQ